MQNKHIVFLVVLVQFINALDFVLVMPMGPDLALGLGFGLEHISWVASSYTISAAVVSLLSVMHLDKFDRKKVLVFSLIGMLLSTAMGGLSTDLTSLLLSRVLAGGFGGMAISIGVSIVADVVPQEQRGKALGMVMAGFPLSAILGIPLALYISDQTSWQSAFYLLAAFIFVVLLTIAWQLPKLVGHREANQGLFNLRELIRRPEMGIGILLVGICVFPAFLIVPHVSTINQFNYGFPRADLSYLYLATGIINLIFVLITGRLADKYSALTVGSFWAVVLAADITLWMIFAVSWPVVILHLIFFVSFTALMIPSASLASKIPAAHQRAGFSALQSFFQYLATGLAASASFFVIHADAEGNLMNLKQLGLIAIASLVLIPVAIWFIERRLKLASKQRSVDVSPAVNDAAI
ncbi:MFS transporter [Saccharophagus degradans]|uniref:MFS transporter n=1 Tax=Saccharophagus degradans TaxID=86304 RepID=A0AAW7X9E8_9GAMM|nr:MFS transporter [Saccharophagus degradans]MDO6424485.1 MFS transporter [Saccharophagus degradans]MDO6608892.1 MFS transporter [Saccharophagus degradans]